MSHHHHHHIHHGYYGGYYAHSDAPLYPVVVTVPAPRPPPTHVDVYNTVQPVPVAPVAYGARPPTYVPPMQPYPSGVARAPSPVPYVYPPGPVPQQYPGAGGLTPTQFNASPMMQRSGSPSAYPLSASPVPLGGSSPRLSPASSPRPPMSGSPMASGSNSPRLPDKAFMSVDTMPSAPPMEYPAQGYGPPPPYSAAMNAETNSTYTKM